MSDSRDGVEKAIFAMQRMAAVSKSLAYVTQRTSAKIEVLGQEVVEATGMCDAPDGRSAYLVKRLLCTGD